MAAPPAADAPGRQVADDPRGYSPCWDSHEALSYAGEVETVLRSDRRLKYFKAMYGNEPIGWSPHLSGMARLRTITNYFTRMRYCTASGDLDLESKGRKPNSTTLAGQLLKPWFKHPNRLKKKERLFFGHWASLNGRTDSDKFIALDTGCVWGGALTTIDLESMQRCSVSAPEH